MKINVDYDEVKWLLDEDCDLSKQWIWNCAHEETNVENDIDGTFIYCSNPDCNGMSEEFELEQIERYFEPDDNYECNLY